MQAERARENGKDKAEYLPVVPPSQPKQQVASVRLRDAIMITANVRAGQRRLSESVRIPDGRTNKQFQEPGL